MQLILLLSLIIAGSLLSCKDTSISNLPEGFVYIEEIQADILQDIKYASEDNFTGRKIEGYIESRGILTKEAAMALTAAADSAHKLGYQFILYDAYRPQRAVDDFIQWAKDLSDTLQKSFYYPEVKKSQLFELNYIAEKSGHSRGSTVDLGLIRLADSVVLDMGTPFDFFGPASHHGSQLVSDEQTANRNLLKGLMESFGFIAYPEEWWHYTLKAEPFPDTYFDFPLK